MDVVSMVRIPGGVEKLRDDRKKTEWTTAIRPFLLARYPVTAADFRAVMRLDASAMEEGLTPAVNVSWQDAVRFCNRLSREAGLKECYDIREEDVSVACDPEADGYRLPDEAEWQYACKAGTTGYRYGELDEVGWYQANSGGAAHAVGGKAPNAWGLHDMLGNVWEWCWDLYDGDVYGTYRVFRGGSWAEEARGCGATCRRRSHPTFRIDDLGFRIARNLPEGAE